TWRSRTPWASAATTAASSSPESNELHRRARSRAIRGGAFLAGGGIVPAARGRDAGKVVGAADDGRPARGPLSRAARTDATCAARPRAGHLHRLLVDLDGARAAAGRAGDHVCRQRG